MLKKCAYLSLCLVVLCGPAQAAFDNIDRFVRDRCASACNGESPECQDCYNEAVDLYDQKDPVSPELNFDVVNNNGKLKLIF